MVTLKGYDAWKLDTPDDGWHYPTCEDNDGYFCKDCKVYIPAGLKSRNWCTSCGKFAGVATECICEAIDYAIG